MANKFLDNNGLSYLWAKIKAMFGGKVDKVDGKGLSTNDYTTAEKTKLSNIADGANKTTVDSALSTSSTNPVQNKVINTALGNKVDKVDGKGLSTNDFSTDYKNKLDGIAAGATNVTVDDALSATSENPVQNKKVKAALDKKVDKVDGKGLSANDYTTAEKNKLAGYPDEPNSVYVSGIVLDGKTQDFSAGLVDLNLSNYAKKSDVSGAFKFGGNLPTYEDVELAALDNGTIYNITAEFTTDATFNEGAGKTYPAGTNIIVITTTDGTKKWDVMSGFVDLSPYMKTADMAAITNTEIDTILAS